MNDTVITKEFKRDANDGMFYSTATGKYMPTERLFRRLSLNWLKKHIEVPDTANSLWFEFSHKRQAGSIRVRLIRSYDGHELDVSLLDGDAVYDSNIMFSAELPGGMRKTMKKLKFDGNTCMCHMRVLYEE